MNKNIYRIINIWRKKQHTGGIIAHIYIFNGIVWKSNHPIKWQHKYVRHYIHIQFHFPSGGNCNVTVFFIEIIHFLLYDNVDVSPLILCCSLCHCRQFVESLQVIVYELLHFSRLKIFLNDKITGITVRKRRPTNTFTWIVHID